MYLRLSLSVLHTTSCLVPGTDVRSDRQPTQQEASHVPEELHRLSAPTASSAFPPPSSNVDVHHQDHEEEEVKPEEEEEEDHEEETFPELLGSGGGGCEFDVRQLSAAVADFAYAPGDRCAVYDEFEERADEEDRDDSGDSESDEDGDGGDDDDDGCYVRGGEMRGDAGADADRATPATKHNPDRDNLKVIS